MNKRFNCNRSARLAAASFYPIFLLLSGICFSATPAPLQYDIHYSLELFPENGYAGVVLELSQAQPILLEASFNVDPERFELISANGTIIDEGARLIWKPPPSGGELRYQVKVNNQRANGAFDAQISTDWALFRGDDIFPAATVLHQDTALSRSLLSITPPHGWSVVAPFPRDDTGTYVVDNPARKFDRPIGWFLLGKIGIRRDTIGAMSVTIAAPPNIGAQRISMLALLNWTLPLLEPELDDMPERLTIVSAGDPMWRGGLSAPNSLYVHADLPLIGEDATSTLLHEVLHVLIPINTADKHDWIDEGIAEYLTLNLLWRSGGISDKRYKSALRRFRRKGEAAHNMETESSSGNITRRAVGVFHELDNELKERSNGRADLFDLIRRLNEKPEPTDLEQLRETARELVGGNEIKALRSSRMIGFD